MIPDRMNDAIDANPDLIRNSTAPFCTCGHHAMYHHDHGGCTICHCRHYTART